MKGNNFSLEWSGVVRLALLIREAIIAVLGEDERIKPTERRIYEHQSIGVYHVIITSLSRYYILITRFIFDCISIF